jgi:hypothetical protein
MVIPKVASSKPSAYYSIILPNVFTFENKRTSRGRAQGWGLLTEPNDGRMWMFQQCGWMFLQSNRTLIELMGQQDHEITRGQDSCI